VLVCNFVSKNWQNLLQNTKIIHWTCLEPLFGELCDMFQKFVILTIVCTLIVCFEILPALMLHTQKKIIWQIAVFLLRHSTTTAWIHSSHTIPGKCFRQFSGTLCSRPTFHAVMQFTNKPFWRHRGYKFTRIRVPVQCANRIVTHG